MRALPGMRSKVENKVESKVENKVGMKVGMAVTVVAAALALTAGCGAPAAQIVRTDESPVAYEIPIGFNEIEGADMASPARFFAAGDTDVDSFGNDPIFALVGGPGGQQHSYRSLRALAVQGRFDPLDPDDPNRPEGVVQLGYVEINEINVWGIRIRLRINNDISDFQALVDRRSDQIALATVHCTRACFAEHGDVIEQIQRSWSLDP